ncbi:hypothetical protein M011DRAFT_472701 [Sporormia fimetaria CBS 119925]|uniref:CHY-type domain-containing protein n=1 Tax=Sporormia fimetaria CBS 119925 TaxID=1340428 RepID=A0A6A6UXQ7_9PLEO|nr:hypothetical protein M011DRAFT_472701 [Sporormia fimetaria CBS 119925]
MNPPPPRANPRITARPTPQAQLTDPRAYQISQLTRRFNPKVSTANDATLLSFHVKPSDPDFPYDLESLQVELRIPNEYPDARPTLRVLNPDMGDEWKARIERGWDGIVRKKGERTLLWCCNGLDRGLEGWLSGKEQELEPETVVKIVKFGPGRADTRQEENVKAANPKPKVEEALPIREPATPKPSHTSQDLTRAKEKRESEMRQLEARMGRLPGFKRSQDGLSFTVPVDVRNKRGLPSELLALRLVKLIVPEMYDLQPCRVELVGVSGDVVKRVESTFTERTREMKGTLVGKMNWFVQNLGVLAKEEEQVKEEKGTKPESNGAASGLAAQETRNEEKPLEEKQANAVTDRPHIITIPRPPEWDTSKDDDNDHDSTSSESGDEASDDEHSETEPTETPTTNAPPQSQVERGVLVSFPHLELHGIELLEVISLNITVKCERCKDVKDITGLHSNNDGKHARNESCKKCAAGWVIGYRPEFIHTNSIRAGYLDLDGCSIVDLLPSSFLPTCAECSTTYPRPGIVSVRGETAMAICRHCHRKMTLRIQEVRFLRTGGVVPSAKAFPRKKKKTESLGIVAGKELPNRGRCEHYKKSYRWFRFSCCEKVFPCDRCHDVSADHPIEHANRMICGFCSREQNYRPKDCGICHAWLTVRPGKGFWEGGQGTRDRTKMSRKDPRKYKRIGGGSASKS